MKLAKVLQGQRLNKDLCWHSRLSLLKNKTRCNIEMKIALLPLTFVELLSATYRRSDNIQYFVAELYDVSQLLKADICSLRSALLAKSVELSDDNIVSDLSTSEAEAARDALCRTMYSRLFTLIVSRINESIKVTSMSSP